MNLEDIYNSKLKRELIEKMFNADKFEADFVDPTASTYTDEIYDDLAQNFIDKQYDPKLIPENNPTQYLEDASSLKYSFPNDYNYNPFSEMSVEDLEELLKYYPNMQTPIIGSAGTFLKNGMLK